MYLSVVIPAYNEEKRIGKTLESTGEYLKRQNFDWEIVVVNNNSNDKTVSIVQDYMQSIPQLRLINEPRKGKGYAVARGMLDTVGEFRLFTDADNSTTIDHMENMMPYFNQGFEVVIGSIAVKGAKIAHKGGEPLWRTIFGKLGNKWIQIFAVWGISDTQRGFKIFTAKATKNIFPKLTIFGWGFDVEVLAIARTLKYRIKEVPITWNNDPFSKVSVWAYPQVLMQTFIVFLNRLFGTYKN